jgi:signal peptidase I
MELRRATEFLAGLAGSSRYRVEGHSMTPALADGQQVLAKPVVSGPDPLPRGTIVVLRHPGRLRRFHIKRIVGLPRENISLHEGVTCVNGQPLAEPYLPGDGVAMRRNLGEWILEDDEYFVMGDNRSDSEDSRVYGPVGRQLLSGVVWLRYWPPRDWSRFC